MNEMNTITINGKTYKVDDRDAANAILCNMAGKAVSITDSANRPLQGLTIYGKTTQNGTPTQSVPIAFESVGNSGSLTVSVMGKNLLGFRDLEPTVSQGGQIEMQDGVITRTATVTANVINIIPTELAAHIIPTDLSPGIYLYSIDYLEKPPQWLASTKAYLKVILDDGTEAKIYEGAATELTQSGVISGVCVSILSMAEGDVLSFQPQLTCGTTAPTAYEPYKAPQTLSIPTPNGLPGIPVTSGGNYTDQKGQQWVCDEIDLAKDVYVQHLGLIESYDGQAVTTPYMSTTGTLTSGASVLYVLATPIETPLADMPDISTLHTNYPNTTITAEGADVAVTYVVDTKTYIDNNTGSGDSGTSITVDDALDSESTNPVQNKVVTNSFNSAINLLRTQVFPNLLPTVTEADNGKTMVVIDGAWTATAVTIPNDAHINALIDARLGVIENGSY